MTALRYYLVTGTYNFLFYNPMGDHLRLAEFPYYSFRVQYKGRGTEVLG